MLDDSLAVFVEAIAVTVRTRHDARRYDRLAALANFEVLRGGNDFLRTHGSFGQMGIDIAHKDTVP